MTLKKHKGEIYFLGIGGIGMSALARYFNVMGYNVSGYDRTPSTLTLQLEQEGINVHYEENINLIPQNRELTIYTPAIPASNKELIYLKQQSAQLLKRAEVLGIISSQYKTIACAGTHGKTTTSTLTSHLLYNSKNSCNAFLGGISKNYESNLLISQNSDYLVAEADEYDRSFLHLNPFIGIITSIDDDHLDIYGSSSALQQAFADFTSKIVNEGSLIIKKGVTLDSTANPNIKRYTYSINEKADFYSDNLKLNDTLYHFDFHSPWGTFTNLELGIPGLYNVENATAAVAAAILCGIPESEIRSGLASFQGVKRRFDIRFKSNNIIYIDDYAHHPQEINACINSARKLFNNKKLTGIFQPHLYSRTRDFADEFADSLSRLDEIILLPIYAAREKPIEGINSEIFNTLIKNKKIHIVEQHDIIQLLSTLQLEILITMGAGDIDKLADPIVKFLNTKTL